MAKSRKPSSIEVLKQFRVNTAELVDTYAPPLADGALESAPADTPAPVVDSGPPASPAGADVRWLPLDAIRVGGINAREVDRDEPAFRELVQSLRELGQLEAVLVGVEDDHYRLIAGERRYWAVHALGWPQILSRVVDAPRNQWPILMLVENLHREDFKPWEEARAYRELVDAGWTIDEISRRVSKSKGHISTVVKIARNARILAALEERHIGSLSLARELAPLLTRDGDEMIPGIIDKALTYISLRNPTMHQLRAWVVTIMAQETEATAETRPRSSTRRATVLKSEEQRLAVIAAKAPTLSRVELQLLAQIYEAQAERLRRLAEADG